MKTICLYHRSDLDGHCSGAVVRHRYPDAEMYGIEYGDSIPWNKMTNTRVILVDFCLEPWSEMERLFDLAAQVIWIDHHRSAIKLWKAYKDKNEIPFKVTTVLTEGQAACELAWKYFFPETRVPWVVNMLARYDVWQWRGVTNCLAFQYGMKNQKLNPKDPHNRQVWESLFMVEPDENGQLPMWIERIIETGDAIITYQMEMNKRIMGGAFVTEFAGKRFLCVNASCINSLAFEGYYNPTKHDAVCTFSLRSDKKWRFTLYSPDDSIDLSVIAMDYGGGGHASACGFVVESDDLVLEHFIHR